MMLTRNASSSAKKFNINKVYVPEINRENHYLTIEIAITSELLQQVSGQSGFNELILSDVYMQFKQAFISICKLNGIHSGLFVANDKLVRLRYGEESQVIETAEQLIVFYDPSSHRGFQSYYDRKTKAKKIQLVVLANGDDIRHNAFELHQQTVQMAVELSKAMAFPQHLIKVKDHQHITYDLFCAEKGNKKTVTHEFRQLKQRYLQQSVLLPQVNNQMGYILAELPIVQQLIDQTDKFSTHTAPYNALYSKISNVLAEVTESLQIKNTVMIANGRHPIVMPSKQGFVQNEGEVIYLGFNEMADQNGIAKWSSTMLTNKFTLVFVANNEDIRNKCYGGFVNNIHNALKQIAKKLDIEPESNQLMVRFHQHLGYKVIKSD